MKEEHPRHLLRKNKVTLLLAALDRACGDGDKTSLFSFLPTTEHCNTIPLFHLARCCSLALLSPLTWTRVPSCLVNSRVVGGKNKQCCSAV